MEDQAILKDFIPKTKEAIQAIRQMDENNERINEIRKSQVAEARGEKEQGKKEMTCRNEGGVCQGAG